MNINKFLKELKDANKRGINYFEESINKEKSKKKTYKEEEIMKGSSDLVKKPNGKYAVDTELKVKKGIEPKVQRALKKSIVEEANKIKGSGLKKIVLDMGSDSEDEKPKKKRGRPKKGKGISDNEEDGKVYKSKVKANPLIPDQERNEAIEDYIDNRLHHDVVLDALTGGKKIDNIMDVITSPNNQLSDEDAIRKLNILDHIIEQIDPTAGLEIMPVYDRNEYIDGKRATKKIYNQHYGELARETLNDADDYIKEFFNIKEGKGLKKRGRPKKGKNVMEEDSSSDEDDIIEYGKILKHLLGHITDKKEKLDPQDVKQSKEIIKRIVSKRK